MELLFIWINQSVNNVFENQGINLSPEFNFIVDVTETGVYIKEDMNWQGFESIFKTDTIVNVTAVVGKNGAGKTTLLKFLYQMHRQIKSCIPGAEGKFNLPENKLIVDGRDEESIVVFYNTGKDIFHNETSYLVSAHQPHLAAAEAQSGTIALKISLYSNAQKRRKELLVILSRFSTSIESAMEQRVVRSSFVLMRPNP